MKASKSSPEIRAILDKSLSNLIESSMGFQSSKVFGMLDNIGSVCPEIISDLFPKIEHSVMTIEAKRGLNSNMALRKSCESLRRLIFGS